VPYYDEDDIFSSFDKSFDIVLYLILVSIIVISIIMGNYYTKYIKELLNDYDRYATEKERFDDDPKNFVPQTLKERERTSKPVTSA